MVDTTVQTVICFDRDFTVSVNAPDGREAVPLGLVKKLAHDTPHVHVWATGNQHLKKEAVIPGVHEARELWIDCYQKSVFETYERYHEKSSRPRREDRLRIVRDVYECNGIDPETIRWVVVDDANLTFMEDEGWEYYTSWDFMPAVRNGQFSFTDDVGKFNDTGANSNACTDPSTDTYIQVPSVLR